MEEQRPAYLWDYDISTDQFEAMLAGKLSLGRLDQNWAALRIIEYAPYSEIRRLIGFRLLVEKWSQWREFVRSPQRREALDFLVTWLPEHYPELLN